MKKILVIICLFFVTLEASAQFFRGVGIFVAANTSRHRYRNLLAPLKDNDAPEFNHFYPQNHHSAEYPSWGVGLLLEFLRYDHVRWQTELEYTMKGALEKEVGNWVTGELSGVVAPNTYQYIQWNNFLKFMGPMGDKGQPYLMLGARLEYLLAAAAPMFAPYSTTAFPKIWVTGDVGIGYERFTWKKWHPFIEFHWNPDVIPRPVVQNTMIRNRTFELRIGIIYRPMPRSIDDCNAPKYKGNYY